MPLRGRGPGLTSPEPPRETCYVRGMQAAEPAAPRTGFPPGPPIRRGIVRNVRYAAGFFRDPIRFVKGRFDAYGDVYYAPTPGGGLFVVRHPDHVREVLSTRAAAYGKQHTAMTQLSRILGEGLLTSEGDAWKRQRRMLQPAFAPARMTEYARTMVEETEVTAEAWARATEPISLEREMTSLTLRVVGRALLGHDVASADIRTIAEAMDAFQRWLGGTELLPGWLAPGERRFTRALAALDALVYRVIQDRRAASGAARTDLLQVLVDAVDPEGDGARLSQREVRDQLVTLFLAGHETTSQALTWTFYCLARSPDVERTLHAELDAVLGGRAPTFADLDRLPYTEQVLAEAMRLYPPVYAIARRAYEDTEVGGWKVPRGSEVMVWVYLTHHDGRFFPEPESFRPERFERERAAAIPKFAYLPFGAGPRACIGKTFALVEARLLLATLASRFRLRPVSPARVRPRPRITLTPDRSIAMHVQRR